MSLNKQQIIDLAPDASSVKAGTQLANSSKWIVKNQHPKVIWGECKGSGKKPYKTSIDLVNIAFKCSCPSRKFPCKHGLGLFLLYEAQTNLFDEIEEIPEDIAQWIDKRATKIEKKDSQEAKPVDEAAQQKRIVAREKKVTAGIEELQRWLKDTIRAGIANVSQDHYNFASSIIPRMVDAQATGLAFQLKKINKINFYEEDWEIQLLKVLSKIYLLTKAYQAKNQYDINTQSELNTLIGWTISKDEILKNEVVEDQWLVLGKTIDNEDNLTINSTWLYTEKTKQFALILDFFVKNQPVINKNVLAVGTSVNAKLNFYPSMLPLRVLLNQQDGQQNISSFPKGESTIEGLMNHLSNVYSINPFVDNTPIILNNIFLISKQNGWYLKDTTHKGMLVINTHDECWKILALSGGKPLDFFVIYSNQKLQILSICVENKVHSIV